MRSLSPRECQVLALAARGQSNAAIALRLRITESTVKVHLGNIFQVLDAYNRTEAVVRWLTGVGRGYTAEVSDE